MQHVAELIIYLWKEHGFVEAGGILKGDELHGVAILGVHRLPGHEPTDGGYPFSHMGMEIPCPDKVQLFQDSLVSVEGVEGKEKAQSFQLMLQHEIFWIRGLFQGRENSRCGKQTGGVFFLMVPTVELKGLPH